jgi:hypothetical protein
LKIKRKKSPAQNKRENQKYEIFSFTIVALKKNES